jgi:hypothetical protein
MDLARRTVDNRIRTRRYQVDTGILVESKTIGTDISYRLTTKNVSRSGMLLSWQKAFSLPFMVNTIIELKIDAKSAVLSEPVSCLGKVVRRVDQDGVHFGVQIIQMENDDLVAWEHCIALIEKRLTQLDQAVA